jgi:hypothetical protein
MTTVDSREATEFVLSRMKVVYLVLLDDNPVGYLPSQATAAAYAARLALQKEKTLPTDSWVETRIDQQDNELMVMRRSLGLVYNSTFMPYHSIKYVPLEFLDGSDIVIPEDAEDKAVAEDKVEVNADADADADDEDEDYSDSEDDSDSDSE